MKATSCASLWKVACGPEGAGLPRCLPSPLQRLSVAQLLGFKSCRFPVSPAGCLDTCSSPGSLLTSQESGSYLISIAHIPSVHFENKRLF